MPEPREGETRDEFVSRCIPDLIDEGREQDQAVAICNSMWEDAQKSADALVYMGGAVKALGNGRVGGYLVRFASEQEPDLDGEFFDAATWYGDAKQADIYYNHGLDDKLGRRVLGKGELDYQDAGVWIEAQLALRDAYERAVYKLAEKGKLGWSSGTAPHLVERNGSHIMRWPLGLDASLTPTPADPGNRALPLKAWAKAANLETLLEAEQEGPAGNVTIKAETVNVTITATPTERANMEVTNMADNTETPVQMEEKIDSILAGKMAEMEGRLEGKLSAILDTLAKSPAMKDAGYISPDSERNERAAQKSFGDWLLSVRNGNATRLRDVYKSTKALGEQAGTAGGYLVPSEYESRLLAMANEAAVIRPLATVIPVGSDSGKIPALDQFTAPTAGVGQSAFAGGVRAYWTPEAGTLTSTDPAFKLIEYHINKMAGYTKVSNELVADSALSIEALLTSIFGRAVAAMEDYAFLRGTGGGMPLGILAADCTIGVTTAADNTWAFEDALNMLAQFWPNPGSRSIRWILNRGLIADMNPTNWNVTAGVDWSQPREALPSGILGYPLVFSEHMPALNTDDALLADLSCYVIFDRSGLQISYSEHSAFTTDEGVWRFVKRLDGMPWLTSYITLGGPTTALTVSPFVYHND